uniref:Uncharacterized protein n=1 Tax=Vitis vinifera TaxID=29760 RepID=A5B679_VITVI|nr:hypothetical protein VITISV_039560 [Vitis vinifera]
MAPRVGLLLLFLLLLASAMVESAAALFSEANWGLTHFAGADLGGRRACNGLVGDCIDPYAETMMDSEVSRRTLAPGREVHQLWCAQEEQCALQPPWQILLQLQEGRKG